jgi:hypothetical protein
VQVRDQGEGEMTYRGFSQTVGLVWRSLLLVCVLLTGAATAQEEHDLPPLPVDPTPLDQLLTPAEKASLGDPRNPKKSVEQYIKISEAHLDAASNAIKNGDSRTAERELDIYKKAVAEACKIAFSIQEGKRSVSKKIEQSLYKQIKLLESIDRQFPNERGAFADAALKHAKRLRVQALNEAFAGGDVLKDPDQRKEEKNNSPDGIGAPKKPNSMETVSPRLTSLPLTTAQTSALHSTRLQSLQTANSSVAAQRSSSQIPGDYLTEEEDQHVREAQKAEDRIKVFMKIADRRLAALKGEPEAPADAKAQKKLEEEMRDWGVLPKMGRADLLRQYSRAIEECMAKLEDAYERNPKSSSIPKALSTLRDTTEKHLQSLRALTAEMKTDRETAALRDAIDQAETANKGARDGLKEKQ